jgi:hypothetical protein
MIGRLVRMLVQAVEGEEDGQVGEVEEGDRHMLRTRRTNERRE